MSKNGKGGPKTALGKKRSSQNARRHGLFSAAFSLSPAEEEEYKKLSLDFREQLKPDNSLLDALFQDVVASFWDLRIAHGYKQQELRKLLAAENEETAEKPPQGVGGSFPYGLQARQNAQNIKLLDALKAIVERRGSLPPEFEQPVTEAFGPNFWKTLASWEPLNPVSIIVASLVEHGREITEAYDLEMPEAANISSEDKKKCTAAINVMRKEMVCKIIDIYSTILINRPHPVESGGAMLVDKRVGRLDLALRYVTMARRDFYRALEEYWRAKNAR